jgi:hypothetical protein
MTTAPEAVQRRAYDQRISQIGRELISLGKILVETSQDTEGLYAAACEASFLADALATAALEKGD